jgi:hypothetical protein
MNLVDALDDVLAKVAAGESLESCLTRYPNLALELAELLRARDYLNALAPAPALSTDMLAARRRQFLSTARAYKRQTTSANLLCRLGTWVWPVPHVGQPSLLSVLVRAAIAFVFVLSIVSGTVAAAQSSLPDSPLYGIKLAVEDVRLNLARDPSQQATLSLSFASERASEMERLAIANHPIKGQVPLRLQNQLDAALSDAARAPEPEMLRLLDRVRLTAQIQERALARAQVNAPNESDIQDALRQAEQAMAQAQRQAEAGLADPDAFRNRYRQQQDAPMQPTPEATVTLQAPTPTAIALPTTTLKATVTPEPSRTPQAGVTPQRNQAGTGQPSTRTPGPRATVTPQQIGPGPQPTGQGSSGPQATGEPGGGSGSGSGTGENNGGGPRRP